MSGSGVTIACMLLVAASVPGAPPLRVQDAPGSDGFSVGAYGDDARTVTCVTGPAGATAHQEVWAWVPGDVGLAYLTLRFAFPANISMHHPAFHPNVVQSIITDYGDRTVEWNMLFSGCLSGWIRAFTQEFVLLDDQPSRIGIRAANSMLRDCSFVLNGVDVLNELAVNEPGCVSTGTPGVTWSELKARYR